MVLDRRLDRRGCLVLGACLIAAALGDEARSADAPARIALLAAGQRASVVVEFADETPQATAIEAPDSRSFAVEIGPVHTTIANQLLQAATQSPLVNEVRVRSVTQGAQGAIITLHVTAKTAVSGFVRRAQRRIYIDLEPLSLASAATHSRAASQDGAISSAPAPPLGADRTSPDLTAPSLSKAIQSGSAEAGSAAAPGAKPLPSGAVPGTPAAATESSPAPLSDEQIQRRAELLARQLDVKSLEKLKSDLIAARPPSASGGSSGSEGQDPLIAQIDEYLDQARKNRLLTDAKLFKGASSPDASAARPSVAPPAPSSPDEAFRRGIVPLVAELQTMNAMLSHWQPGFVPAASLPQSLEALTIRLRALRPPVALRVSHEQLCVALGALAKSWVPGPDGVSLVPVGNDARLIVSAKAALYDYLQGIAQEESTEADRSATGRS